MSTLEARIAEVLAEHDSLTYDAEHRETICTGCGWAMTNVLDQRDDGKIPERRRAHQAAMLAPIIREARAEAWERCDEAWERAHKMSNYEPWEYMDENPYRHNDE